MLIVKCKSCGFELYRGYDLMQVTRVLDEYGWKCPVCLSPLGDDVSFFVSGKYTGTIKGNMLGRQIEGAVQAAKRRVDYSFLRDVALMFVNDVLKNGAGDVIEVARSEMKRYLSKKLEGVRGFDFVRFYGAVARVFERYGYVLKDEVKLNRTNAVFVFARADNNTRSDS